MQANGKEGEDGSQGRVPEAEHNYNEEKDKQRAEVGHQGDSRLSGPHGTAVDANSDVTVQA